MVLPPAPRSTNEATRRAMQGNRSVDTKPEVALRKELHRRGLRFRKDFRIEAGGSRVKADVVFTRARVAVFVDGCYWHGCPAHCRIPASNTAYWTAKIERNRARDARVSAALTAGGWTVLRLWEHEPLDDAAARVAAAVAGPIRGGE